MKGGCAKGDKCPFPHCRPAAAVMQNGSGAKVPSPGDQEKGDGNGKLSKKPKSKANEKADAKPGAMAGPAMALPIGGPWLLDSGSTFDLIDRDRLGRKQRQKIQRSDTATSMWTANGAIESSDTINLHCGVEKQNIEAVVVKKSPCVLSMGRRC